MNYAVETPNFINQSTISLAWTEILNGISEQHEPSELILLKFKILESLGKCIKIYEDAHDR